MDGTSGDIDPQQPLAIRIPDRPLREPVNGRAGSPGGELDHAAPSRPATIVRLAGDTAVPRESAPANLGEPCS
jgi:hypothetical protein